MLTQKQIQAITNVFDNNNKIKNAWVFGSFARNEETKDSDIDILFSFKKGKSFGYIEMYSIVSSLERILKRHVDFIKEDSLLPFAKETANKDKILIYGN